MTVYVLVIWTCLSGCRSIEQPSPFAEMLECLRAGDSVVKAYKRQGDDRAKASCEVRSWNGRKSWAG